MFTTPDVRHLTRSPTQTFTTPFVKSDVHHPRHSPPQTFTTPYSKMRHSPPTSIHHPLNHHPQKKNAKCKCKCKMFLQSKQPCTRAVECSPSSCWWYLKQSNMEMILQRGWWMSGVVNVWGGERLGWWMSGVVNRVVESDFKKSNKSRMPIIRVSNFIRF